MIKLIENELVEKISTRLEALGYTVVEVQFIPRKKNLRVKVTIYHPAGISHQDCSDASQPITEVIEEYYPEGAFLEVSSPGIGRVLKNQRELVIFEGHPVKVLMKNESEAVPYILGPLKGDRIICISDDDEEHAVSLDMINRIMLE